MIFELPEILIAERAGRAMAMGVGCSVEIGVSSSLAGAAALAAARRISNSGQKLKIILTDSTNYSEGAFKTNLEIIKKMGLVMKYDQLDDDFPCVISGTDSTATLGSENFVVAKFFVNPEHDKNWDGWQLENNPFVCRVDKRSTITVQEARTIDVEAVETYGLPSICLMENAGIGAAVVAEKMTRRLSDGHKAVVLVGGGNNGGDGLVVARGLVERRVPVQVVLLSDVLSEETQMNLDILEQADNVIFNGTLAERLKLIEEAGLVVDGIFGTGLNRDIQGEYREVIEAINRTESRVLALDVPSGIDADTGEVRGIAVEADVTVSFAQAKLGMFMGEAKRYCGDIIVADIGAPKKYSAEIY